MSYTYYPIFTELASATGEFAARIHEISESDVGASLSQSIAGLAAVQRKAEDIQNEQSRRDVITILSTGK
jgi:sorting nexin-1/2